jgi:hypothetical protein
VSQLPEGFGRLALTLHHGHKIQVGEVYVMLRRDGPDQVQLVFEGPKSVPILRHLPEPACSTSEKGVD